MQLLKIEWLKIKNYRTFWILISIFAGLYLIINYVYQRVLDEAGKNVVKILTESYSFPYVWNTMAYIYSWLVIFLCMYMIISIANEYTFKTQRQHIIDGMHRLDFLNAKAILILVISLAATIFYTVLCLLFGLLAGGNGIFEHAQLILYAFIYTVNYISLAALLALFIKRSGLTIIIFLAYLLLENGVGYYINNRFDTIAGNFFPLQSSDELLPSANLQKLKSLANQGASSNDVPIITYLIASIIFIALYYFLARRKMLKSDL